MTSPLMTYASVTELLDYPIAIVWPQVAAFGEVERWIDGVSDCTVEGHGVGAIRTVTRKGNQVRERLEQIDEAGHMLRYLILPPHTMPADDVHGNIMLRAIGAKTTEMVWRSDATAFRVAPEILGGRIEDFYRASIDGLRKLLDAG